MCCCDTAEFFIFAMLLMSVAIPLQVYGRTIEDEFKDFCNIMPTAQIKKIAESHIKSDKEFNEAVIFLQSNKWNTLINDMKQNNEWKTLKKCLNESGLNLDIMVKSLFNFVIDLKPIPNDKKTNRSLRAFFDEVEGILPLGKFLTMLHEKKQKSPVFQTFYKKFSSPKVHKMFESALKQPEVVRVLNELKCLGVRVDEVLDLLYGFMNWDSRSSITKRSIQNELKADLEDFKKLIPWEKIRNISNQYLTKDTEFAKQVQYIRGEEFSRIVRTLKSKPEYQQLQNYVQEAGIDIEELMKVYMDLLVPDLKMPLKNSSGQVLGYKEYLKEIKTCIPADKVLFLFNEKMKSSANFRQFINKLSDRKFQKIIENVRALPEFSELTAKVESFGVRVREIFDIIYVFLGWQSPFEKV